MADSTLPVSPVAIGRSNNHGSAAAEALTLRSYSYRFHFFIGAAGM